MRPSDTVARSYGSVGDAWGRVLPDNTLNCASGGVYMSTKDLARFMTALDDPEFLDPRLRDRMINDGPSDDLFGFGANPDADGGRSFTHTGRRVVAGDESIAAVVRFPNGAHVVFTANSPAGNVDVTGTLIAAYNAARR